VRKGVSFGIRAQLDFANEKNGRISSSCITNFMGHNLAIIVV
jgi:hypothetical protein